jgi:hypothetical protein
MRFRLGLVIGFAAGYYLGSAAGRERHNQINRALARLQRTEALELATGKARAVVDLTVERARDIVDLRRPEPSTSVSGSTVSGGTVGDGSAGPTTNSRDVSPYSSSK